MIKFCAEVWPGFESVLKERGPFKKLDILTAYLGSGAHKVLDKLNVKDVRIVFGLEKRNPSLTKSQFEELQHLKKTADVRIFPGLHAKEYMFDDKVMVFGSPNFTRSGFERLQEAILITDEANAVKQGVEFFNTIWKKSSALPSPIRIRESPDQDKAEGCQGLGHKPNIGTSPFSNRWDGPIETPAPIPVRLCVYDADWILERDGFVSRRKLDSWSTGRRTKPGDIQIFCISRMSGGDLVVEDDPRIDAVHSIWMATSEVRPELGNEVYPDQARFKLLVKLDNPIPKADLVKAKLLVRSWWPQGSKGKLFHSKAQVETLARILSQKNPQQRKDIWKALGLQ